MSTLTDLDPTAASLLNCTIKSSLTETELLQLYVDQAEACKTKGNVYYKECNYQKAIECYSEAVHLQPHNCSYYANRAAAFIMLQNYQDAVEDAELCVVLEKKSVRCFLRLARCQMALGELKLASENNTRALALESNNKEVVEQTAVIAGLQNLVNQSELRHTLGDNHASLFMLERALQSMPAALHYRFRRAELLVALHRYHEAKDVTEDILRQKSRYTDALWLRGYCLYFMDQVEKAMEHWTQVLRVQPDHTRAAQNYRMAKRLLAAKEEGNLHVTARRWNEAVLAYERALDIDPKNGLFCAKLHCNRAHALMKLRRFVDALDNCDKAIELNTTYAKAYLRRAKCYEALERWEEAVGDHEMLMKLAPSVEQRRQVRAAQLSLKKSKRKDYYKVLAVSKDASNDEVRKAYHRAALAHHPDRHASSEEAKRKESELQFKEVGEAYAVLNDASKRGRYDAGHDLDDLNDGQCAAADPNDLLRMFFKHRGGMHF